MHRIDEPHPFALEAATLHYAAHRPVRARHLTLELDLDLKARSFAAVATHTLEATRPVRQLTFDAAELDIDEVKVDGRVAEFDASGAALHVHLERPVKAGAQLSVRIAYRATPRRGLYFVGEQVWTQGQDEDSRFWFPCLDAPAQRSSTEVKATFPAKLTALSNGRLVADTVKAGRRTMHYRLDAPHAPYLVTLVVGQFETHLAAAGKTRVRTLFPRGRRGDALRCVARTPEMVALFEKLTGQGYPWGEYAQVFVKDFIFGGMENTGASTLTDAVLHDARAHQDYDAEFLIAHELAHQWFGDLLTCRDWSHGWLNEGFATYAEVLWKEHADGFDEADHQRRADLDGYLEEVAQRYARPIVARKFEQPIDLFDRHLYEKGGLVLHELRRRLGDEDFFKAVRLYVKSHHGSDVETVDLARAVERATGKNVDRFFDEYVHRAGHPQLKVDARYDAETKVLRLAVTQTQAEPVELSLPVRVAVGAQATEHLFELSGKEHVFQLPLLREPTQVVVDGRRELLATLAVEKPAGWWREELAQAPWGRARTEAALALGKDGAAASVKALGEALRSEAVFWGSRAACARALGAVRSPLAREQLLRALGVKHPRVRRAVVAALGDFRGDEAIAVALGSLARRGDASYFVEAELARSLGRLRGRVSAQALRALERRPSFQDVVRCAVLNAWAELQDPVAWPRLVAAARAGQGSFVRRAAVGAMARLAEAAHARREAVELFTDLLRDGDFRVRMATIDAAGALGDERMVGPLTTTPFLDGRERRLAKEAARTLRGKAPAAELTALRAELDTLKGEVKALKEKAEGPAKKKARRTR